MFYDVPVGYVQEELKFHCELEPFKARDANSIRLKCPSTWRVGQRKIDIDVAGKANKHSNFSSYLPSFFFCTLSL